MSNPYTPTTEVVINSKSNSRIAIDLVLWALLVVAWLASTYAVSLPRTDMLTRESSLIALSPFIPIYLLTSTIIGETIVALLLSVFAFPFIILIAGTALGVRKNRTWIATIALGVLYGLFLRLFYQICSIA